ncbi:MAG TPA: hypothetical protein DDY68_04380 [Porphyromonadaceae bacterium]|nr:hypothetical protein [Porphyromonadaceae bacterium]
MTLQDTLRDIRKTLRLYMNGVASTQMRERGLEYKLNFGLSLPEVRRIASQYMPSVDLAEMLWEEEVRELKLMATLLYPQNAFSIEVAKRWILAVPNIEVADCFAHHLLIHTKGIEVLFKEWLSSGNKLWIYTTLSTLIGLLNLGEIEREFCIDLLPSLSLCLKERKVSKEKIVQLFWQLEECFPPFCKENEGTISSLFPKEIAEVCIE